MFHVFGIFIRLLKIIENPEYGSTIRNLPLEVIGERGVVGDQPRDQGRRFMAEMEEHLIGTIVIDDLCFVFKGKGSGLSSIEIKQAVVTQEKEPPEDIRDAFICAIEGRPYKLPTLNLSTLTPFRVKVLNAIRSIPFGSTLTYKEVATSIGKPNAARAVGQVMALNPIPIFFP